MPATRIIIVEFVFEGNVLFVDEDCFTNRHGVAEYGRDGGGLFAVRFGAVVVGDAVAWWRLE